MKWVGNVARISVLRNGYKMLIEPEGIRPLGDLVLDLKIILKFFLDK